MDKKTKILSAVIGALLIVGAVVYAISGNSTPKLGGFGMSDWNVMQTTMSFVSTNTSSTLPVKVIARDSSRQYVAVCNNSDTSLYIFLYDFASALAASTTVVNNSGIRLNSNGGCYEILPENMWIGDIWVATATTKNIIATYK